MFVHTTAIAHDRQLFSLVACLAGYFLLRVFKQSYSLSLQPCTLCPVRTVGSFRKQTERSLSLRRTFVGFLMNCKRKTPFSPASWKWKLCSPKILQPSRTQFYGTPSTCPQLSCCLKPNHQLSWAEVVVRGPKRYSDGAASPPHLNIFNHYATLSDDTMVHLAVAGC